MQYTYSPLDAVRLVVQAKIRQRDEKEIECISSQDRPLVAKCIERCSLNGGKLLHDVHKRKVERQQSVSNQEEVEQTSASTISTRITRFGPPAMLSAMYLSYPISI